MPSAATLETLPTELRIEVLKSIPDACTLRCLLNASPIYYRAYIPLQREVLTAIISRQYFQGTAADVVAAILSIDIFHACNTRTKEEVIAFLDRYRHARGIMSPNALLIPSAKGGTRLTIKELHKFQTCIELLMDEYLKCIAESNFYRQLCRDTAGKMSLSSLQRMRIVRAICRVQVYSYVFYQPRHDGSSLPPVPNWKEYFELEEVTDLFHATFAPWERDEMWAMYEWFEDWAEEILDTLLESEMDTPTLAPDRMYTTVYLFSCLRLTHISSILWPSYSRIIVGAWTHVSWSTDP